MSKYPNVGEIWVDDDSEQCEIVGLTNGKVKRKFLNNIGGRKNHTSAVDLSYFLMSWKRSESCRVTKILSMYGE